MSNKFTINNQGDHSLFLFYSFKQLLYNTPMDSQDSQTQVSIITTPMRTYQKKNTNQKTTKKKNKTKSKNGEDTKSIKTLSQTQDTIPKANFKKIKVKGDAPIMKTVKTQLLYTKSFCNHAPVFQKLSFSIIMAIICILLFTKPPVVSYPIAEYSQGSHKAVFQVVTDRSTRNIEFNFKSTKKMGYIPIDSVKTARIKAKIDYSLGYQFQNKQSQQSNGAQVNQIQMSDLKILHYSIGQVQLLNRDDGLWNTWEFDDHQKMKEYIRDHYIQDMKTQTLQAINDQRRKLYESKAKFMLSQIIDKSQNWFSWLLKRIDKMVDGGLMPYIQGYKINEATQKANNQ